ncbi:MAG TPA: hypothetical protein VN605_02865, partial [Thermoanaerobaculia bacterium]|nr:hypothetical protein [Thermoanaerobaculia bacterium]
MRRRDVTDAQLQKELEGAREKIESQIADAVAEEQKTAQSSAPPATPQVAFTSWFLDTPDPAATAGIIRDAKGKAVEILGVANANKAEIEAGLAVMAAELDKPSHAGAKGPGMSNWWGGVAIAIAFMIFGIVAIPGSMLVYLFRDGWGHVWDSVAASGSFTKISGITALVSLIPAMIFGILGSRADAPWDKRKEAAKAAVVAKARELGEASLRSQGWRDLHATMLATAKTRTDTALVAAVAAHLREFIALRLAPSYSDELPDIDLMNGLAEVLNSQNIVDTTYRDELVSLMQSMPGGSIGLAGPRGAGKSTILTQLTQLTELRHNDGSGPHTRKVLGVFTSAPVQYDGREFILHLFAAVCDSVLKPQARRGNARTWEEAFEHHPVRPPSKYDQAVRETVTRAASLAQLAAVVLLLLSLAAFFIPRPEAASKAVQVEINGTKVVVPPPSPTPQPSPIVKLAQRLGLEPLPLAVTGLQCLIFSILFGRFVRTLRDEDEVSPAPAGRPRRIGLDEPGDGSKPDAWTAVTASAAEWDLELRYQQSFTSGWSGALKLPVGIDTSTTNSTSLIARQLTFPELAQAFRQFLATLAPWYVVVIAIDELDKIATAERAQQFLNEVKAVFGVRGVFYLVSVSDSAISSFSRRGLGVRDAFDSAFDEIVRIGYLDHAQAKSVLSRRVIGLSEPVVGFCHCLSGGLPRDLIRACRALFHESNRAGSRKLSGIALTILRKDLLEKIDSSITHILDLAAGSTGSAVLVPMRSLRRAVEDALELYPPCQSLLDAATRMVDVAAA